MKESIDIKETPILQQFPGLLELLLIDHTMTEKRRAETGNPDATANIFWATDIYQKNGVGYGFYDEITPERITGSFEGMVKPRSVKSREEQLIRTRDKAEVFTPSWICNAQNNLVDDAWFGRKDVFNAEYTDDEGRHLWRPIEGKIAFPDEKGKSWKDYVRDTRLEITCGEAPYLVSRYDTTTGEPLELSQRIGLLDRKLRVVSENTDDSKDFLDWAQVAYKNTYGYEWQGDSILLARENLLYTFLDYYVAKFGKRPVLTSIKYIAYIVSWNIWQMDGIKMVVPGSCESVFETNLFGECTQKECIACKQGDIRGHIGVSCKVRDWRKKDKKKQKITFASLLN